MRKIGLICFIFFAACGFASAQDPATAAESKRPNVIWVVMDALRSDNLSCYGYSRPTSPHMDALAARGVRAGQHFTQGLWTTVSVPSYMTGRYFPVMVHESVEGTEVERKRPPEEMLAPEIFRENGYHTAMITSHPWFTPRSRLWHVFDESIFVVPDTRDQAYYASFGTLNRWIFQWLETAPKEPFFLYIHILDTHFPHLLDPPFDLWADPKLLPESFKNGAPADKSGCSFSAEDRQYMEGIYDGSILYSDYQLSLLLWKLNALGALDNTVILVGADHGDLLGEDGVRWGHPPKSYDLLLKVPFIMAGPGIPEGKVIDGITENADIVPTLVELLGLNSKARFDGRSLLPMLRNEGKPEDRQYAFSKYVLGGYDGKPGLILWGNGFKYEWDMYNEKEYLWAVPDVFPAPPNVMAEHPDTAAAMKAYLEREIVPKWHAYLELPERAVALAIHDTIATNAFPQEALVIHPHEDTANYREDNKWGFDSDWRRLWARAWMETPPPLTFRYEVPPGRYRVQLRMFCMNDYLGNPASSFAVRLRGEEEYRIVQKDDCLEANRAYLYVDAGEYATEDGIFEITLKTGSEKHWAVMSGFQLIRMEEGEKLQHSGEDSDVNVRFDQLRALGYIE